MPIQDQSGSINPLFPNANTRKVNKVISYVMTTITNTNPAILKQMLDQINDDSNSLEVKDQIIDYVMYSTENTNPAMLRYMLDNLANSGGSNLVGSAIVGTAVAG